MKPVSDAQVRMLMAEMTKYGHLGKAAMKSGMDRGTARGYLAGDKLPSELVVARDWRTRPDPFVEHWPEVEAQLIATPGFDARTLFEELQEKYPGRYPDGQLRTLQRRVRRWRAEQGPDKDVEFGQRHRPGEAAQTDFTWATKLGVTIAGQVYAHMLCVLVLPFSNWQWATVCMSESMQALRRGLQRALFQLGRVPLYHQTDNSTAATHNIPDGKAEMLEERRRPFNADYLAMMRHFSMTPRTIEVGESEQNGDVEAGNGALKRRLEQALLRRGSREFPDVDAWQTFIDGVMRKANLGRGPRIAEEMSAMRELNVARLPEFHDEDVRVSDWSTIRIKHCAYSVPSRLIGEWMRVRVYDDRIVASYADKVQLACERLHGRNLRRIDYRHVIWSLVRKPGAFERYVYREEMFPTVVFRRAYDAIQTPHRGIKGDLEYLRVLHLAASTMESEVAAALELLLAAGAEITCDAVKTLSAPAAVEVPVMLPPIIDLSAYDALLAQVSA